MLFFGNNMRNKFLFYFLLGLSFKNVFGFSDFEKFLTQDTLNLKTTFENLNSVFPIKDCEKLSILDGINYKKEIAAKLLDQFEKNVTNKLFRGLLFLQLSQILLKSNIKDDVTNQLELNGLSLIKDYCQKESSLYYSDTLYNLCSSIRNIINKNSIDIYGFSQNRDYYQWLLLNESKNLKQLLRNKNEDEELLKRTKESFNNVLNFFRSGNW